MGQITNRGLIWELLNSWWIIPSFIFISWIGFFYIGIKAKKKMWVNIGFAFLLVFIFMVTSQSYFEKIGIWEVILLTYFFGGIVLAFIVRKEYLIRFDMLQKANVSQIENNNIRNRLAEEFLQKGIAVDGSGSRKIEETMDAGKEVFSDMNNIIQPSYNEPNPLGDSKPIDINSCSIESLSNLPGITMILAKKAINYRNENNGFTSVKEFYKVIELKPHFIAQIDNKLICNKLAEDAHSTDNSQVGRSLDL